MSPTLYLYPNVSGPNRILNSTEENWDGTEKKLGRNRKARKELARRLQSENPELEVVHPHAAGIDVGNSAHFTADLHRPAMDHHLFTAHPRIPAYRTDPD